MRAGWIAAVVLLGSCAQPRPERLPRMPRDWPETVDAPAQPVVVRTWWTDPELREFWWDLRIDGTNYQTKLAQIPPELRVSMASVLLRDGGFRCETIVTRDGCALHQTLAAPAPSETIGDPCLRRYAALWALDQIQDPDTAAALFDPLIALVRIPAPELELGERAIEKLATTGTAQIALWEAEDAGNDALVTRHLDLLDDSDLFVAATDRHIDGAVLRLLPTATAGHRLLPFSALDPKLRVATRLAVIDRIVEVAPDADADTWSDLEHTLHVLSGHDDCSIAAAAAGGLVALGGDGVLPRGPFQTQAALIHAACATLGVVGASGAEWRQVLTPHALPVTNHLDDPLYVDALWTRYPFAYDADADGAPDVPEADADHDGVPSTRVIRTEVKPGKRRTVPFADELRLALPHCDDELDCAIPGTSVHFRLDVRKERGTKYRLHALERFEHVGFDC